MSEEIESLNELSKRLTSQTWGYGISGRQSDEAHESIRIVANAIRDIGIACAKEKSEFKPIITFKETL